MQQKLLVGKIYLFCIYFCLNNFNYPNKKLSIPSKLRNSSAKVLREKNKTCLGFEVGSLLLFEQGGRRYESYVSDT